MYVAMDTACFLRYEAQLVVAITSVCFFKVWSPVCGCYYHCLVFKHWSILLAHLVWCHLSTGRREVCMSPCPSVDVNICRPQIAFLRAHWFSQNPQTKKKKVLITKRFQPRDWSSLLLFLLSLDPLSVALRIDLVSSVCRFVRACQRKWRFLSVLRGINRFLISRVLCVFSAVLSVCLLLYVRHTVTLTLTPASALPLVTYLSTSRGNADTRSCQERMNVLEAWSK